MINDQKCENYFQHLVLALKQHILFVIQTVQCDEGKMVTLPIVPQQNYNRTFNVNNFQNG